MANEVDRAAEADKNCLATARLRGSMTEKSMPEKKVRFAEFEFTNFGRFQLYRSGCPVRLEGLPLQLLMFLIENQRRLVTREQIADALWGKDVFVNVEQEINTAVRKVRMALGDDSAQPQYLQTVVGRGYRFVAPTDNASTNHEEAAGEAGGIHGVPGRVRARDHGGCRLGTAPTGQPSESAGRVLAREVLRS